MRFVLQLKKLKFCREAIRSSVPFIQRPTTLYGYKWYLMERRETTDVLKAILASKQYHRTFFLFYKCGPIVLGLWCKLTLFIL